MYPTLCTPSSPGTNNARLAAMLRQLAQYHAKDPNNLFMVRLAQVMILRSWWGRGRLESQPCVGVGSGVLGVSPSCWAGLGIPGVTPPHSHLFSLLPQGLTHLGKGTLTLCPYHSDRQLMSQVAVAGLLTVLVSFLDVRNSEY